MKHILLKAQLRAYREQALAVSISAGVITLDLAAYNHFKVTLNANVTSWTLQNIPASPLVANFTVRFTNDGTPRTVALPSGGRLQGGGTFTPTGTNLKVDYLSGVTYDGGTTWDLISLLNF